MAKVFISWSKPRAREFATFLAGWLPSVIQAVKPFISMDIEKGLRWFEVIEKELADCKFGIICVTPENQDQPWLLFEAGAIAAKLVRKMAPITLGFAKTDLSGPLSMQNATDATEADIFRLLVSINNECETPISADLLRTSFKKNWDDFLAALEAFAALDVAEPRVTGRSEDEKLDELLILVRGLVQFPSAPAPRYTSVREFNSSSYGGLAQGLLGLQAPGLHYADALKTIGARESHQIDPPNPAVGSAPHGNTDPA